MEERALLQTMTNTRIFIVKGHGHKGLKDGVRREPKPEVSCMNGIVMRVAKSFYDIALVHAGLPVEIDPLSA